MISIKPFEHRHLVEAGQLFAAKYRALLHENSLLPAAFQEGAVIQAVLEKTIREHSGVVAIQGQRVVGYLTAIAGIPELKGNASGVIVPVWGHCIADGKDAEAIYAPLYARMAAKWVEDRCYTHLLTYFVPDARLESLLFDLGFGLFLLEGIRDFSGSGVRRDDAIEIAEARESDLAGLMKMERRLAHHLRSAPIFLDVPAGEDNVAETRAAFLGKDKKSFVAKYKGEIVACIRGQLNMGPGCDLFDVEGSLGIDFGYTDTVLREMGIATSLLNALLRWGSTQGMARCVVDFESANLVAKAFWLRHFQPVCHSVMRRIDERM